MPTIKSEKVTITTSGTGSAIAEGAAARLVVACCIDKDVNTQDYLVIPYRTVTGSTWVKVFNWSLQPVANTEFGILVYYFDI